MVQLIKSWPIIVYLYALNSGAVQAATTNFKANIIESSCEVSVPEATITFSSKSVADFPYTTSATELHPLNVELNCQGTTGFSAFVAPYLRVTGEASGLSDTRLFRSGNSDAAGVGFMLKKGALSDLSTFYSANGTVAPGDAVNFTQTAGVSTQQFTVGLVRGSNEAVLTGGNITAKISFALAYP